MRRVCVRTAPSSACAVTIILAVMVSTSTLPKPYACAIRRIVSSTRATSAPAVSSSLTRVKDRAQNLFPLFHFSPFTLPASGHSSGANSRSTLATIDRSQGTLCSHGVVNAPAHIDRFQNILLDRMHDRAVVKQVAH